MNHDTGNLDHRTQRLTDRYLEYRTAEERSAYLTGLADAGCQGIYCPVCLCEFFPEQLEAHLERPACGCPDHAPLRSGSPAAKAQNRRGVTDVASA
jgi:hypothetical protein